MQSLESGLRDTRQVRQVESGFGEKMQSLQQFNIKTRWVTELTDDNVNENPYMERKQKSWSFMGILLSDYNRAKIAAKS